MPPEPPVIIAPASGNPIINTKFSAEILFTPSSPTTYPVSSHKYRLLKTSDSSVIVDWTTVPSNPFTISSLLASTNYTLHMTAVDNQSVESASSAGRTFTTKDDILIQAPTPGLTSPSITHPTSIYIGITYSAGIPTGGDVGGNTITLRQYAVTTSASTPASYSNFPDSSGTVNATTTTAGAALATNTTYYVHFKYTDSTAATSNTQNSIKTAAENAPGIPAASTFTKTGTSTATLTRGDATKGTYNVAYQYRYWESNSSGTTAAPAEGWASMTSNPTLLTGLKVDTYYDAQVRAVNVSPGTLFSSPRDYSIIQTDPAAAEAPSFTSSGMTGTSTGTITAIIPKTGTATKAFVEVSTNSNFSGAASYNSVDNSTIVSYDSANTRWIFSLGSQAYNSTIYYRAKVANRIGGESSYSGTITWVTPKKNQDYALTIRSGEWRLAATNSILEPACTSPAASHTFGFVPASDNTVGYINLEVIGVQLRSGDSGFTNTTSTYLYFSTPSGQVSPSNLSATNTGANHTLRFDYISVGGSTLSNGTVALNFIWTEVNPPNYVNGTSYSKDARVRYNGLNWLAKLGSTNIIPGTNANVWVSGNYLVNPGGSAARISSYCLPNGTNWFWAKDFYITGKTTTVGTITG
jgi:hypothetical protein